MGQMIDVLDYKPDNFQVAPKHEWRLFSMGHAKRGGTQPRFCAANCPDFLNDKDGRCGRFYECNQMVFDMHQIKSGESIMLVMFATETDPPHDGLSWWVSEAELIRTMGKDVNGDIDEERGRKIVDAMIAEYNALQGNSLKRGIVID